MVAPKFLAFREVEIWKHRFDPETYLYLREIERRFGLERHLFGAAQLKLKWNIQNNCVQPRDRDLIDLAKRVTEIEGPDNVDLIDQLVARRAQQVNWEIQRQRYQRRDQ